MSSTSILSLLIGYGTPIFFALALSLISVAVLVIFIADPKWPAFCLFIVILIFINPSYGFLESAPVNVYTWGRARFFLPLLELYLCGLFIAVAIRNKFSGLQPLRQAGGVWLTLFSLMFFGHFVAGIADDVDWLFILNEMGLVQIVYMGMLIYVVVSVLQDTKEFDSFLKVFLLVAVGRAIFGLGRYIFFGGDPQNGYANLSGANFKITFWDLNEGLIACISAFYFAHRIVNDWANLKFRDQWLFILLLALEISVVILSYRRISLFGLFLVAGYFLSLLPWRKRILYAVLSTALVIPPALAVLTYRTQEHIGRNNVSLVESLTQSKSERQDLTDRGGRFYELQVAFRSLEDQPILGIGSWNAFKVGPGDALSLAYHQGNYYFVHSGFGHVLLKSGFLGLILFLGILISAWHFSGKYRPFIDQKYLAMFESYRAGLFYMLPTLAVGTPIVEMRTMLWIAMILAVPIAVARFFIPDNLSSARRRDTNTSQQRI